VVTYRLNEDREKNPESELSSQSGELPFSGPTCPYYSGGIDQRRTEECTCAKFTFCWLMIIMSDRKVCDTPGEEFEVVGTVENGNQAVSAALMLDPEAARSCGYSSHDSPLTTSSLLQYLSRHS
jgi:hypothetical protein